MKSLNRSGTLGHARWITPGAVAVLLGVHDHPEGVDVGQLAEAQRLPLQLAPDGIGRLLAAEHAGRDAAASSREAISPETTATAPPCSSRSCSSRRTMASRRGVQVLEGELLQLAGDAVDADGARQRGVDVERLAGDPLALLLAADEAQGAHVVQPVGQLHQQHPHVARDGQDELAQVLRLPRVLALQLQRESLVTPLDQLGDLLAEQAGDLGPVGRGVLDDVVQQGGDDGGGVQPVLGQDAATSIGWAK
jgi:hypothetical protein